MKIIAAGHIYEVSNVNPHPDTENNDKQIIKFVKRFRDEENHPGTLNQELLRVLINRVEFLNKEIPWDGNNEILYHLRMALVLHESRALFRKVHKGDILPESIETDIDGHFKLNTIE